jgi:hypothetical protein
MSELLRELKPLKTGFEYPAGLFNVLKNTLKIKKGALLLPENENGLFVPWSITGFDKTTQHRLHILPDTLYTIFRTAESKNILTDLTETQDLRPCFSSREAALVRRLLLCLFTFQEKIIGALIISDSPYLFLDESGLRLFFTVIGELSSPLLERSRNARLRKKRLHAYLRKDHFLVSLKTYLKDLPKNGSIQFLVLNAQSLVAKIREFNPDVDEYRVLQDITTVVSTLMGSSPVFVSPKKKKILIATQEGRFDSALLVHQVSLMIRKLFQELQNTPDIEISENSLPSSQIPEDVVDQFLV